MTDGMQCKDLPRDEAGMAAAEWVAAGASHPAHDLVGHSCDLCAVMDRGDAFRARVKQAGADMLALADLMAEAIDMRRAVMSQSRAGSALQRAEVSYCLDAARAAYQAARMAQPQEDAP